MIIIIQENHSFDNYFGTYPTANGTLVTPITSELSKVNGIPNGVCLPYQGAPCLSPDYSNSTTPTNPVEGQVIYEDDYKNNASGFPDNSGSQSMVYFDYHTIPAYWDYAEEYGLGDNYFASLMTQTNANRLAMLTGDTPIPADNVPPPYIPYNESVMSQLDSAGVSWGYFDYLVRGASVQTVKPLNYFSNLTSLATSSIQDLSAFYKDLSSGSGLPALSFVSSLENKTYDEHPPSDPTLGEQWVVSVINKVMASPYWDSTAIFLTWDEGGGFYDHVVPPVEFTLSDVSPPVLGLGPRVPILVISPYSKENYVSNTLLSHLSLIHFVEYNWNLPPLDGIIGNSTLPLDFFNFSQAPRSPIILSEGGYAPMTTYPIPLQIAESGPSTTSQTTGAQPGSPTNYAGAYIAILIVAVVVASVGVVWWSRRGPASQEPVPSVEP